MTLSLLPGDAATVLRTLPDGHFHACITRPPYHGMRDYKVPGMIGLEPTCECGREDTVPCRVLDPFAGAGTTLLVADRLGRDATGIELNPEYLAMAKLRIETDDPARVARLERAQGTLGGELLEEAP